MSRTLPNRRCPLLNAFFSHFDVFGWSAFMQVRCSSHDFMITGQTNAYTVCSDRALSSGRDHSDVGADCRKKRKTFLFLTLPHIIFFPFKVRLAISLRTCPKNNKVTPSLPAQRITDEQTQIDCYLFRGADRKDLELSWSDANPLGLLSSVASKRRNPIQITAHNALSWRIYFYPDSSSTLCSQCRTIIRAKCWMRKTI